MPVQIFCVGPKIYLHIVPVTNILCQTNRWFAFSKIGFCAGTKVFEEALKAVNFLLAPPDLKTALVHTMKCNLVGQQRQARGQKCEGKKLVIIEANLPVWLSRQKAKKFLRNLKLDRKGGERRKVLNFVVCISALELSLSFLKPPLIDYKVLLSEENVFFFKKWLFSTNIEIRTD